MRIPLALSMVSLLLFCSVSLVVGSDGAAANERAATTQDNENNRDSNNHEEEEKRRATAAIEQQPDNTRNNNNNDDEDLYTECKVASLATEVRERMLQEQVTQLQEQLQQQAAAAVDRTTADSTKDNDARLAAAAVEHERLLNTQQQQQQQHYETELSRLRDELQEQQQLRISSSSSEKETSNNNNNNQSSMMLALAVAMAATVVPTSAHPQHQCVELDAALAAADAAESLQQHQQQMTAAAVQHQLQVQHCHQRVQFWHTQHRASQARVARLEREQAMHQRAHEIVKEELFQVRRAWHVSNEATRTTAVQRHVAWDAIVVQPWQTGAAAVQDLASTAIPDSLRDTLGPLLTAAEQQGTALVHDWIPALTQRVQREAHRRFDTVVWPGCVAAATHTVRALGVGGTAAAAGGGAVWRATEAPRRKLQHAWQWMVVHRAQTHAAAVQTLGSYTSTATTTTLPKAIPPALIEFVSTHPAEAVAYLELGVVALGLLVLVLVGLWLGRRRSNVETTPPYLSKSSSRK